MAADLAQVASSLEAGGTSFTIEGVTLIDGTGVPPRPDTTIVVRDGRIVHAGPASGGHEGFPGRRHALPGKTVIPGLIEAHTHAAYDADMCAYVQNGITTVRFAGLDPREVAALRRRIATGALPGPRILSCGPMIDGIPAAYPDWSVAASGPAEAAAAAVRLIEDGDADDLILTQRVTAAMMRAVCEVAHKHGRRVLAQSWAVDGAVAAACGIDELHNSARVFHSREYPPERLLAYETIADRLALSGRGWATIDWDATQAIIDAMLEAQVVYCGMQVITQYQLDEGVAELRADPQFITLFSDADRERFLAFIDLIQGTWSTEDFALWRIANENRMEWMRRFRAGGGVLVFGTDMQFGGIMLHRELGNARALGMTPLEVIAAATGGTAAALGLGREVGTIRPGLAADLIVLNRDPADDLAALRDIHCVFREGRLLWQAPQASQQSS